mmetsp:Transcript_10468/g.34961  ORF Transcript_10468/g.34961 Transcript_10468/m.34961 type:complete len:151 (+) Transcript_10468:2382-2834(+)
MTRLNPSWRTHQSCTRYLTLASSSSSSELCFFFFFFLLFFCISFSSDCLHQNDAFKRNTIIPHVYKESIKPILDFIQELSGSTGSDVHVLRKHMQKDEKHLLAQQKRDRQEAQRKQGSKEENEREMRREEQNKKLSKKEQRHLRRQQASA